MSAELDSLSRERTNLIPRKERQPRNRRAICIVPRVVSPDVAGAMKTVAANPRSASIGAATSPKLANPSSNVSATESTSSLWLTRSTSGTTFTLPDASQSRCRRNCSAVMEIGDPEGSIEWYVKIAFMGVSQPQADCVCRRGEFSDRSIISR